MAWSPCGQQLASGGNDNMLAIHDTSFRLTNKVKPQCHIIFPLARTCCLRCHCFQRQHFFQALRPV